MNIFIDTNVYLSFYHLTSDDLEELSKLSVLLENGQVVLFLPDQVRDEYSRNREAKVADALKRLGEKVGMQLPVMCKDYREYARLKTLLAELESERSALVDKMLKDIEQHTLKADEVIEELFSKAKGVSTGDLLPAARDRVDIGNPPGKRGSLGDALNWEALLHSVPDSEDLWLIADDRDYFCLLDDTKPKQFLLREWKDKKKATLHLYRRMSPFFKAHYPQIKLASELERELAVHRFVRSGTFQNTHGAIRELRRHESFSASQVNSMVRAGVENSQVNLIIGDDDVFEFLSDLVNGYSGEIEAVPLAQIKAELDDEAARR